jgi:hypothetical protein
MATMKFGHHTAAFDGKTKPYVKRELLVTGTEL